MAKTTALIRPSFFQFFVELAQNNERSWFQANKERYEAEVRAPLVELVKSFAPALKKISPHFVADPRPVGGSILRIQRDVRFSKDKSPYKVHAGVQFRHTAGKDIHAPGFYLHLEPGGVFVGAGVWHPEPPVLARIRQAILEQPAGWKKVLADPRFRERCRLDGESLSRAPKGFDPAHPLIEDLKRKDFISVSKLSDKQACAADFLPRLADDLSAAKPLMRFLARALDLPF